MGILAAQGHKIHILESGGSGVGGEIKRSLRRDPRLFTSATAVAAPRNLVTAETASAAY